MFDCPDGTDEDPDFCDLSRNRDVFLCCNSPHKVPLDLLCDGYDDCPRDKSDQYLAACFEPIQNNVSATQRLNCPDPSKPYVEGTFNWLTKEKLNDGVSECLFDLDESCAWKDDLHEWVSPTETKDFKEYLDFLELAQSVPSATRWYTMAAADEAQSLGHKFEVRFVATNVETFLTDFDKFQDLVIKCIANNKPCAQSAQMQQTVSQDFGNCFSFNFNQPVTTSGRTYGIQIWFNLEVYDTLGLFTPNSGLKLYVTSPGLTDQNGDVFVDLSSEINLAPGFDHSVSVQPKTTNKLPLPYSLCEHYKEGRLANYNTKLECQTECIEEFVHTTLFPVDLYKNS